MSLAMNVVFAAITQAEERIDQSPSSLWPEGYEIWFGGTASVLIFALLIWKAGPLVKKGMAARTARVQAELDSATADKAAAETEAATIRAAKGDIGAERQKLLAAADEQATVVLAEGRSRLDREVAELQAKAATDIQSAMSRSQDELRAEIARLASAAADRMVVESLDDETQQRLVENFIERVGGGR